MAQVEYSHTTTNPSWLQYTSRAGHEECRHGGGATDGTCALGAERPAGAHLAALQADAAACQGRLAQCRSYSRSPPTRNVCLDSSSCGQLYRLQYWQRCMHASPHSICQGPELQSSEESGAVFLRTVYFFELHCMLTLHLCYPSCCLVYALSLLRLGARLKQASGSDLHPCFFMGALSALA